MYKRLLYIFSLAFVLTNFLQPAQAAPDINIDEDVAEEPAKATAYRYWIDDNTNRIEASLNGEDIESNIDVSSLNVGVHIYHMRVADLISKYSGEWIRFPHDLETIVRRLYLYLSGARYHNPASILNTSSNSHDAKNYIS